MRVLDSIWNPISIRLCGISSSLDTGMVELEWLTYLLAYEQIWDKSAAFQLSESVDYLLEMATGKFRRFTSPLNTIAEHKNR